MNNIWRKYHDGALIPWKPPHLDLGISKEQIRSDIAKNNAYFARWTTDFDSKKQSVFWYIINDKKISLNDYSVNTRSKINRGLKKLITKRITKEELIKEGYLVYEKALKRYDVVLNRYSKDQFVSEINSLDESWDCWGVFSKENDSLVAYSLNRIVEDYCDYSTIKFDPDFLKEYSSYVLYYSMNKYYLCENDFQYVNNGTRSISHQTNIHDFLIDKFKFRKAYCNMQIEYSAFFGFLVKNLFFIRSLFSIIPLNIFRRLNVVMYQEEIRILCENIFSFSNKLDSRLILSNGNFKSGSTWVTAILNELCDYDVNEFPKEFQNPKHVNWIHRFKIDRFLSSDVCKTRNLWISKSHIFQDKIMHDILINQDNIKIINIDRDIKDVLVSHYHHLINAGKIRGDFHSYFYKWGKFKAQQCVYYKKAWKNYDCLKLDYSDLINHNKETILEIARYLGLNISEAKMSKIQKETDINNLRVNSKKKNLNEEDWFYRKGETGDWKNYFDDEMLKNIQRVEASKLTVYDKFSYFIKFTFRLKLKYFLYRYFPTLYVKFDKFF
jgi:hypothetical protein